MKGLWQRFRAKIGGLSLFARLALGFGLGFLLLHALIGSNRAHDAMITQAVGFAISAIDRAQLLQQLTQNQPELLSELSTPDFKLTLQDERPVQPEADRRWRHEPEIRSLLDPYLRRQNLQPEDVLLYFQLLRGQPILVLSLPLGASPTESWLVNEVVIRPEEWQRRLSSFARSSFLALLIFGLVIWTTRRVTRFVPPFVDAAERMGRFADPTPLPEDKGPKEIRRLGKAFNSMQTKISQHERERSAMLGALSHDIRTLVTRVGLRLERAPAVEAHADDRTKSAAELAQITQIVDDALAYAKIGASVEASVPLDLHSLLQALVDDLVDAQQLPVQLADSESFDATLTGQPVALRRAFENLINNAVLYGQRAEVKIYPESDNLIIEIVDAGPGIPEADRKRVLEPYVRLETSRNRDTGGTGLGLAIAHAVLQRHGGDIEFFADAAGFHTLVVLPYSAITVEKAV